MSTLLLLATLSLPSFDLLPVPRPRARAAEALARAVEEAEGATALGPWISAGRSAIAELGAGDFAATLEQSILDARWRAVLDPERAAEGLERELRSALVDLEFTLVREANLPRGFPEPTPVRELELKRYPAYRMARADMGSGSSDGAFWRLFQHIQRGDIAMTAPVEMSYSGEEESSRASSMAFLYGSPEIGEAGREGDVQVVDVPAALVLSLGCRGRVTQASLERARARLEAWVSGQDAYRVSGELRTMSYNGPSVPVTRSFYEVQLPMEPKNAPAPKNVVVDFTDPSEPQRWNPINDGVMGGLSSSRFAAAEGYSVFTGRVSLENNGGFASVRRRPDDLGLTGASALSLTYRGDGQRYKLRLRTSDAWDGVSYEVVFRAEEGRWQSRTFDVSEFVPVWRGRRVRDARPLRLQDVRTVGLMISDKQVGPFRLELASLSAE